MDACLEASIMASCVALLRDGQLDIVRRIFAHLKKHHNAEIALDPSVLNINNDDFQKRD